MDMEMLDAERVRTNVGRAAAPPQVVAPSAVPGMGAVLAAGGCSFRVWAPFADEVYVAGSFTQPAWEPGKIALQRDAAAGPGRNYWSAFVPGVAEDAAYRIVTRRGGGPLVWKMDPYGRDATSSRGDSLVRSPDFSWDGDERFGMPAWNELVIYELHVGTFNDEPGGPVGTFADVIDGLDDLADLGVNAIEIMPATDFDTETSMGYNPSLLFALEGGYGDPHSFKRLVREAHRRGIAVILDVVYNHLGPQGLDVCMARFDGWFVDDWQGIYFYADDRAETPYGRDNRPDFGRPEVRQILRDNALSWLHEFRIDGLRLDSTIAIRRAVGKDGADRGEIGEGWQLLQWIASDKRSELPWKILIAEDLQGNEWITRAPGAGGAGCDSQWDIGFYGAVKDALVTMRDEDRDLFRVRDALYGRYNGDAFQRVIYTESHDEVGKRDGIELGRMPNKIWWGNADSWVARKRSTLGAGLVLTAPGIPMLFQGQEFLEWETWTDQTPLDWSKEQRFGGIRAMYRDLIRLRRNFANNTRGLRGQNLNVFHTDGAAKVIAFHRWGDGGPGDDVVVVANFADRSYPSYNVGFPRGGTWYLRFNSDWNGYAGDFGALPVFDTTADGGANQNMPVSGNVALPPYSLLIYSQ
jgi:1,4-alpha-glucan branching enzyme